MIKIEFHTKSYGITKSKDPLKNNKSIGLQTRIIIQGRPLKIINFDFQYEANKYLKDNFGKISDGKYMILSNFKIYGNRGYRW